MKPTYVYPGTFSPPTYGHLSIVRQAAAIFPEVIILCSKNPEKKEKWFTPEKCKELWKTYSLPRNIRIMTQAEFESLSVENTNLIIIRGLRGVRDLRQENKVMLLNKNQFGIKKYFYIFGPDKNRDTSSSRVRQESINLNLKNLNRQVSPLVISALLEKVLKAKNIFLVVGRPGSGKSTLLEMLSQMDSKNYWLNTDIFNQQLRSLLAERFGKEDLIKVALEDEKEMKRTIAKPWLKLLANSLKLIPPGSNIFIEIAYGLQADKSMFRFVGGKIIYIGCNDEKINFDRVIGRNTPQLTKFIQRIPNHEETMKIAKKHRLSVSYINTDCSLDELLKKAKEINNLILGGLKNVYHL